MANFLAGMFGRRRAVEVPTPKPAPMMTDLERRRQEWQQRRDALAKERQARADAWAREQEEERRRFEERRQRSAWEIEESCLRLGWWWPTDSHSYPTSRNRWGELGRKVGEFISRITGIYP
jgi:hypothetical protein